MGIMLVAITTIWAFIFITLYWRLPDHRREMIWAGGLSAPLALLWGVANYDLMTTFPLALSSLALRLAFGFLFAGVAAALHELLFYKHLKLIPHPHRSKLAQLLVGPLVFLILVLIFQWTATLSLFFGFLAEVLVLTYHRKELLWEAIVSGLFMAGIYLIVYLVISRFSYDSSLSLWVTNFSGVDVLGLPIEEILLVFGYGMLWGPLYEGVKKGSGKLL